MKHCPRCDKDLPLDDFGASLARKDGKNIYCKNCNRERTAAYRFAAKEELAGRVPVVEASVPPPTPPPLPPDQAPRLLFIADTERLLEVLRKGPKTRREMAEATQLSKDRIGEALVDLILWRKDVGTSGECEDRIYFLKRQWGKERAA